MDQPGVEQDGGDPHDRVMEARVTRLEDDMTDVRAILRRLEPMIVRIDAAVPHLATKLEVADLRTEMRDGLAAVRGELHRDIGLVRTDLHQEIVSVRTELREEMASVKQEVVAVHFAMGREIGGLHREIGSIHREMALVRQDVSTVRVDLSKEVSGVREELATQIGLVRAELERRPTSVGMWTMGLTVATLALAGLAGGAVFLPFIYRVMHIAPP